LPKIFDKRLFYKKMGYFPHPGQQLFHNSRARFRVAPNGRRFGKTMMGSYEIEPRAWLPSRHITGGPQLGWIVGPQYSDTEKEFKIVYDDFRKIGIDKEAIKFQNNADNGSFHIKTSWGFELLGKSAKHPESLVGEGLDFVLMVEAGRHKRATWGQYIRPTLSDKKGWAAFTGVPEGKSEHSLLYALWGRGNDPHFPNWESWKLPSWSNTIIFPGGRQDSEILEAEADLTHDEFMRQYGAEFVDKVGAVMQEWDDEIHLCDQDYNPDWPLYIAVDYGFTNPFVVLFIQVDEWGTVYVIKERRFTQVDTPDVVRQLKEEFGQPTSKYNILSKIVRMYPDPAEPDDTYTMSNGLKIPSVKNTGGELKTRLSLIRSGLKSKPDHLPDGHPEKKPKLLVNRSECQQLAWEMSEGYRWPEHKSEIKSDSEHPLDKDNHGPEALGRFYRGYFGIPGETQTKRRTKISRGRMG
jgi:hypothetical protein